MTRIQVEHAQATQCLKRDFQLATLGASTHKRSSTLKRNNSISRHQLVAAGIIEAKALGCMARAGNNTPGHVILKTCSGSYPRLNPLKLPLIGWHERVML